MFNKILDGYHVKKASLEHTVKHTFKLNLSRTLFVESLVGKFVKIWTMF